MLNAKHFGIAVPLGLASLMPASCLAQSAAEAAGSPPMAQVQHGDVAPGEIVVTASKRAERLIDVPISVVAITGDALQQRQVTSMEDLARVVPDLSYNNVGSNHYFAIRGISNIIGASPLIGVYLDEADVTVGGIGATQINPVTYDIERVEVLRGPQGTLYGEGSEGGTIRFVMRNPDLHAADFAADVAGMYTEHGSVGARVNAVVNLPVVNDVFAVRVVGTLEHDAGWIDQPAAGKNNINAQNLANIRIKALWQVAPDLAASAMVIVNRDRRGTDVSDTDNPYRFTQVFNQTTQPTVRSDYELYNLTLAYDLGQATLLNTGSYLSVSTPFYNQSQVFPFAGTGPDDPRYPYYAPLETAKDRLFTDELRLSSSGSGPWKYTVGGFYRHFVDRVAFPVNYFGALADPYSSDRQTTYNSVSGFIDTSYRLWDRLTLGAGVRYFHDHQDFVDRIAVTAQRANFSSTDPRFYGVFKVMPKATLYASAAKGFRSGGFNNALQPAYQPESVWTYEVGAKGALLDDRLSADLALFTSKYKGYQVFGIFNADTGANYVANAGQARIKGVEWDFSYRPVPQLSFQVRGDYVVAHFTQITPGNLSYLPGDKLDLVPPYQITAGAEYDFSLQRKKGSVRLDYSQQGRESSRDRSIGDFYFGESDVLHLLDFDSSFQLTDKLTFGLFAQNLTNEHGFANPYDYIASGVRPRPRTYGIRLSIKN